MQNFPTIKQYSYRQVATGRRKKEKLMKSTTLIEMNDPKLIVRGYDLGHKIASNLVQVFTLAELEDFEQNLGEIRGGLIRFANRQQESVSQSQRVEIVANFKTSDTDLAQWLAKAEVFAKKYFDLEVKLSEVFQIPETVPWKSILPVFVPAGVNNRKVFEFLFKLGLNPWEETDVMNYTNSGASNKHQLFLINNSERPDKDTMGLSLNKLRQTQKLFLGLCGYGMAMGFYHEVAKEYLDPKETFTWFPEDRLPDGGVARGCWYSGDHEVRFDWYDPDCELGFGGARLAISVPFKP
jgi:hypothetical protein